jgi:hypothetical protein
MAREKGVMGCQKGVLNLRKWSSLIVYYIVSKNPFHAPLDRLGYTVSYIIKL